MTATAVDAVRIGIVEDHRRYREALEATVNAMADVEVVWTADDSVDALAKMEHDPVDLAVVDLSIPGENGIALIGRLRTSWPATTCIVVSGHTESSYVRRSFRAGATAYIVKGRPADLRHGIAAALRNERFLSPILGGEARAIDGS